MKKKRNTKTQSITELLLVLALLVLLNLILSNWFFRIDLTKEKRYSLSEASINLASKVDDVLYVKCYLQGDFPAGFKRLSKSTREMLDEFSAYTHGKLQYEFIDPFSEADAKKTGDIVQELGSKGLQPTSVQIRKDDEQSQKIIVPGAIFYYKGKEVGVNLLKGQFGANPEDVINGSVELLEYQIANAIRKMIETAPKSIAFLEDHGELDKWDVAEAKAELDNYYSVKRVPLSSVPVEELYKYAGLIIAHPTMPFSEYDKFKLDQYIMNGGKIMWLIDTQIGDMDSLQQEGKFVSVDYDLRLNDMLFLYGARVNSNLVKDIQCEAIPILSGMRNGLPQQKLLPWLFFPVASPTGVNPIVKNMDPVWFQFASSIDTNSIKGVRKTVLLETSPYARTVSSPVRVDLEMARVRPEPDQFSKGAFPLAVLLEGSFSSVFRYRGQGATAPNFKSSIDHNKMIIVGDGDVIRNQRKKSTGEVYPLGYDRYTGQQFGNKNFIINCMDYLCDDSGILEVRGKEITLRMLNKAKIKKEKMQWQLINICVPLLLVLLFGAINRYIRKRKYTRA